MGFDEGVRLFNENTAGTAPCSCCGAHPQRHSDTDQHEEYIRVRVQNGPIELKQCVGLMRGKNDGQTDLQTTNQCVAVLIPKSANIAKHAKTNISNPTCPYQVLPDQSCEKRHLRQTGQVDGPKNRQSRQQTCDDMCIDRSFKLGKTRSIMITPWEGLLFVMSFNLLDLPPHISDKVTLTAGPASEPCLPTPTTVVTGAAMAWRVEGPGSVPRNWRNSRGD